MSYIYKRFIFSVLYLYRYAWWYNNGVPDVCATGDTIIVKFQSDGGKTILFDVRGFVAEFYINGMFRIPIQHISQYKETQKWSIGVKT